MEKRIKFNSEKERKIFFNKSLNSLNFLKWKELEIYLKINRSMLENYRNGKLTLPEEIYKKLTSKLTKEEFEFFEKNISYLDSNWGVKKGGLSTYLKHRYIFEKGRVKGIKKLKKSFKKFDINLELTRELAYFIGLFIGDGFTNKYDEHHYITQFVGCKSKELEYYQDIFSKNSNKIFGLTPKISEDKKFDAIRINFYSKDMFDLITKRFNIKAGRKSHDVLIPDEILNSTKEILLACIAGFYDAEGFIYLDKRNIYKKPYPILGLHINNPELIKQIDKILLGINIKHLTRDNFSRIDIYGKEEINNFIENIKILNPKHLKKIDDL